MRRICSVLLSGAMLLIGASLARAADEPSKEGIEFFEKNIRPVLSESCYKCHSVEAKAQKKLKSKFYVDSWQGIQKGGDDTDGPEIVPGNIEKSPLIKAIRYEYKGDDETMNMPPSKKGQSHKLSDEVIKHFEEWVKMGAPHPKDFDTPPQPKAQGPKLDLPGGKSASAGAAHGTHWAFVPPVATTPPTVKDAAWVHNDIDRFVLARLEAKGLSPNLPADRQTLIRRVSFDLTGLPPTPEEVTAFEQDSSSNAYDKVVDRLLASPRYGERWARHWLDVARYSDTKGYVFQEDRHYPFAYTFRDWVIGAFNKNLPYDRFLMLQIAADKMDLGSDNRPLAAMGFLTVGRRFLNAQPEIINDRIDVVCRGTMGLTVECARCHDHKFDPIPQADYYALYGVFASSMEPKTLPQIAAPEPTPASLAFDKELKTREGVVDSFIRDRSNSILAQARTAKSLSRYLLAAGEKAQSPAGEPTAPEPNRLLLRKWRECLARRAAEKDPIFAAWRAYAAIPSDQFSQKAPAHTDDWLSKGLEGKPLHPLIAEAIRKNPPTSLQAVADIYGELLARFDTPEKASDANEESLRLVLRGAGSPLAVASSDATMLFRRDDREKLSQLRRHVDEWYLSPGAPARAMVMEDAPHPHDAPLFLRGNANMPGKIVPRHFLTALGGSDAKLFTQGSGRLELAQAIASRDNPLTARVFVNRVWMWHFGAGIVGTPSDFGMRSDPPTHPRLLDWLAVRFMDSGWSIKDLQRLIVTSSTYRQSSDDRSAAQAIDPENALLWRFNRQRLDFEETRDALLFAGGQLDTTMYGRPVDIMKPEVARRTVYGEIERQNLPGLFRAFDFASPDTHAPMRFTTTVPQQALFFMNSPFVQRQTRLITQRPAVAGADDASAKIQRLYQLLYGRDATAEEVALGREYIGSVGTDQPQTPVWQYGYGRYDEQTQRIAEFTVLPHFTGHAWQGGAVQPNAKTGFVMLSAQGGHPGDNPNFAAIRRWTAPSDLSLTITGALSEPDAGSDGVRGRIVSSRTGLLGEWSIHHGSVDTHIDHVSVTAGETLDFITDCLGDTTCDSFSWAPILRGAGGKSGWSATNDFAGPVARPIEMTAWDKYTQVLLESNEFVFID